MLAVVVFWQLAVVHHMYSHSHHMLPGDDHQHGSVDDTAPHSSNASHSTPVSSDSKCPFLDSITAPTANTMPVISQLGIVIETRRSSTPVLTRNRHLQLTDVLALAPSNSPPANS